MVASVWLVGLVGLVGSSLLHLVWEEVYSR